MGIARVSNKGLKALIVFLVIAVVGLVAGVVVVNVQKNDQPKEIVKTDNEIYSEIVTYVYDNNDLPVDDIVAYLDEQLEKDISTDLACRIAILKSNTYNVAGMTNDAIGAIGEMCIGDMEDLTKIDAYSFLAFLYHESGDEEKATHFEDEVALIKEEINYTGVGE